MWSGSREKGFKYHIVALVVDDAAANINILFEALGEDYTVRVATTSTITNKIP
jgi:hypothetical protein